MPKKKFPQVIYVTFMEDDPGPESLLAWSNKDAADEGRIASYQLIEEGEKRSVTEFRRKGTKRWFK